MHVVCPALRGLSDDPRRGATDLPGKGRDRRFAARTASKDAQTPGNGVGLELGSKVTKCPAFASLWLPPPSSLIRKRSQVRVLDRPSVCPGAPYSTPAPLTRPAGPRHARPAPDPGGAHVPSRAGPGRDTGPTHRYLVDNTRGVEAGPARPTRGHRREGRTGRGRDGAPAGCRADAPHLSAPLRRARRAGEVGVLAVAAGAVPAVLLAHVGPVGGNARRARNQGDVAGMPWPAGTPG
ncbi:MAG: hypothetical protein QOF83_2086 [Solirubrobacteraceae bacterium]|jgi:hypothetical protein|nr:hypothetical protein [Solirubrobacteraceae bacterium]